MTQWILKKWDDFYLKTTLRNRDYYTGKFKPRFLWSRVLYFFLFLILLDALGVDNNHLTIDYIFRKICSAFVIGVLNELGRFYLDRYFQNKINSKNNATN